MYARGVVYIVPLLALLFAQTTVAQVSNSSTVKLCNETSNMDFDVTQVAGIWYEVARNPSPIVSLLCTQLNVTVLDNSNALNLSFTYSNTPLYPWVNQTMSTKLTLTQGNTDGYNITYEMYGVSYPMGTYKLLNTNYKDYAFVCGFTNVSDVNSYFGVVLTRERNLNNTIIDGYAATAATSYANFSSTNLGLIGQPDTCTHNNAMGTSQLVSTLLVLSYALLALLC